MKRTVQSEMNDVLRQIGKADMNFLIDEAEDYICALCDMERKPCEIHAGAKCAMMIREGTELELLRSAEKQQHAHTYGYCATCGSKIHGKLLRKNPLSEICIDCKPKPKRITA
jgi:hypothetical protein